MSYKSPSKLNKWRAKYGALAVALGCLYSLVMNWGNNWVLTGILGLGVFVCGTAGIFDIRRAIHNKKDDIKH